MNTVAEVYGWVGAATLLTGYALVSLGRLRQMRAFQAMNLFGAGGVALAAWDKGSYPATTLNVVWMCIAVIALIRTMRTGINAPARVGNRADSSTRENARPAQEGVSRESTPQKA